MNISYDYYRIFYYVAKYGNITKAAAMLLANQPNLTRSVHVLESELGCALFIRSNRGMKLTPEGERLYRHVRVAFEQLEAGEAEVVESRNLETGSVYIAVSEVALHCVLLPALKIYRSRHPRIRLKISNHSTPQAIDEIKNGTADLAVVSTPTVSSAMLTEEHVASFREITVAGAAFSALRGKRVSFSQLLEYPLVSLSRQTKSFELYSHFFASEGLRYLPETETATADQILPLVRANLGIGFVPQAFLNGRSESDLFVVETEKPLPEREICIVKRKEQTLSLAARELERLILSIYLPGGGK